MQIVHYFLFCFILQYSGRIFDITGFPVSDIDLLFLIEIFTFIVCQINQIEFYSEDRVYLNLTISCLLYDTEKWHGMNLL